MGRFSLVAVVVLLAAAPSAAVDVIHVPGDVATLQAAINLIDHGGVIEMAAGTYVAPTGGFNASNLSKSFTIRAADGATVVLDGANANPVFKIIDSSPTAGDPITFDGLVFYRGRSLTDGLAGGVTLSRAEATFMDCVFSACSSDAPTTGGGGAAAFMASKAVFFRCQFLDNWASNEGGALRVGDGSEAWVAESEFERNYCNPPGHRDTSAGGAIHVTNSRLRLASSRLEDNEAGYAGGGLYVLGSWVEPVSNPSSHAYVTNCTFVDNLSYPDGSVPISFPTEGGGLHAEDQSTVEVFSSRFVGNAADTGGGVNLYRAIVAVYGGVFQGNRATSTVAGRGFGGALCVISNDTTADGSTNRRAGQLIVGDTLVQGAYGSTTSVAQLGGGLFASGDQNRRFGLNGVTPTASAAATRCQVSLTNVVFADCDVLQTTTGGSWGGGIDVALSSLTVASSLVVGSDAVAAGSPTSGGGGARAIWESDASFSGTDFAVNTGYNWGGAFNNQGAATSFTGCGFYHNSLTGSGFGPAMFSGPLQNVYGNAFSATGTVASSTFSANGNAILVWDNDSNTGAVNDLRYSSNTFYLSSTTTVYADDLPQAGLFDAAGLNALVVDRPAPAPDTDKGSGNVNAPSSPLLGAIRAVPPWVLPSAAAGDPDPETSAYVGYAWSGGSATLDGAPVTGNWGLAEVGVGTHTLSVAGTPFQVAVAQGALPIASLTANPVSISSGQTSTLSWNLQAGTFLAMTIDQGATPAAAASGSVVVAPTASTTYRLVMVTAEGSAVAWVRVYVDEPVIFADGFNSGTTGAWSATQP